MTDQEVQRTPTATLAYSLVGDRLHLVEREIERACNSEIALVRRHSEYVVQAGGKRLRPAWSYCARRYVATWAMMM